MIDVVTMSNVHNFKATPEGHSLIYAQHQVRYKALKSLGWKDPVFDHDTRIEYDDFDTPLTRYLIKRNNEGRVQGVVRINPTNHPYMLLKSEFESMVQPSDTLPRKKNIWEGSRIAFDPALDKETRRRGVAELALAKGELMREMEIDSLVGMMPEYFWNSVFKKSGWHVKPLGQEVTFKDGSSAMAAQYRIGDEALEIARAKLGIEGRILNTSPLQVIGNFPPDQQPAASYNNIQPTPLPKGA